MDVKTTTELSYLGLQLFHRGGQLTGVLFSTLLGTFRFEVMSVKLSTSTTFQLWFVWFR